MQALRGMQLSKMKAREVTGVADSSLTLAAKITTMGLFLEMATGTKIRNKRINWMKVRIKESH